MPSPAPHLAHGGSPPTRRADLPTDAELVARRDAELAALPDGAFTVAECVANGAPRRVLRRTALHIPHRGTRTRAATASFVERCALALRVAPLGSALSHDSAARLLDLWLPWRVPDESAIHVIRPSSSSRLRRSWIVEHRGVEQRACASHHGLLVTSPADTWADLAPRLAPYDLVALGDGIAAGRGGIDDLTEVTRRRSERRAPGAPALRWALPRLRAGSASRMESIVRCHLVDAGLPEPRLNAVARDHGGEWLGVVDFLWPGARVVAEYQGREFHLGARRHADESRRNALEAAGYRVVFITGSMLATQARRDALTAHLSALIKARHTGGAPTGGHLVPGLGSAGRTN